MRRKHARRQVLEYIAKRLASDTDINCVAHKVVLVPAQDREHIDMYIEDEVIGGDDSSDEFESTLETEARVAPMVVRITVKGTPLAPDERADEIAGLVEVSLLGDNGCGDHEINEAWISCSLAGTSSEKEDDSDMETIQLSLIFNTSYRTEVGNPFDLI